MDLSGLRRNYDRERLRRAALPADPLQGVRAWVEAAAQAGESEPNAMTLATVDADGHPHARIVLLKGIDERGLRFFSNYDSDKGRQLDSQSSVALVLHWHGLERQVRIEGRAERLERSESEQYFASRPRESQLGAWASAQSRPVADRAELERSLTATAARFPEGSEIPVPPNWGGYLVRANAIEFWQGGPGRMHDRLVFTSTESGWNVTRLSP